MTNIFNIVVEAWNSLTGHDKLVLIVCLIATIISIVTLTNIKEVQLECTQHWAKEFEQHCGSALGNNLTYYGGDISEIIDNYSHT
jgi:hypothetical protein